MQISRRVRRLGLALAGLTVVVSLASCGGNGDGGSNDVGNPVTTPPVASNTPPASASVDTLGFIAYLKILTATTQNTVEPLDLTGFVAPTDDTGQFDSTI